MAKWKKWWNEVAESGSCWDRTVLFCYYCLLWNDQRWSLSPSCQAQFSSVQSLDRLGHWVILVFSVGGSCEQFWQGQGFPLFDAVHPAFLLLISVIPHPSTPKMPWRMVLEKLLWCVTSLNDASSHLLTAASKEVILLHTQWLVLCIK